MGTNAFHRLRLLLPPSTGRSPSLDEGGLGFRRSRPPALPSIAYRGFAVAPMTLRALARRFLYNSGCRVATLVVSMGVMGFLGDLRGRNSKSPPNPLGLAERVPRPQAVEGVPRPHSVEGVPPSHPAYSEPFSRIALSTPSLLRYPSISRITVSGGSGVPASAQILTACIRNSLSL